MSKEEEARREHTRAVMLMLKAVRDDVAAGILPDKALVLAFTVGEHLNWRTGECFQGQETLAREIESTERTVRRLMNLLIERKHFEVAENRSRFNTFRYKLAEPDTGVRFGQTGHFAYVKPDTGVRQTTY